MKMARAYTIQKFGTGYMHYIELGSEDVQRLTADGNKRVVCKMNNKLEIHAAIMKTKEGMYYVMIAAKYLKQLNLTINSKVTVAIEIDKTALQFNVPEEFAEVMATDSKAKEVFDHLTAGNKRGLIALVNMVKSSDKKIERALLIAEKLKAGITSPQKIMARKP
ncbi:YdeI/OmpD-associated family protein [Lacibacter sediminis]|uniref:YdeI/OmpD-associated family protein n=1 Tax=Lacibacter sediminis TaxID=2760713 RepID=A0A7G5XCI8_9BACT|nr:YdeI/OmpD-associated family protein [Lacibacter sediminis]QNA43191.1 YdeI/OmpD-associated family protein [Lacibacter sediminis]